MHLGDRGEPGAGADGGVILATAPAQRPGLRERKRRRTHATIAAAALELFARQGFQATTIAQIADAADVSPRTVSAYFPEKEALAFPEAQERFDGLADFLRGRPEGQLATDALRAWVVAFVRQRLPRHEEHRARRLVIDANPELLAYERRLMSRVVEPIAEAVARDLGRPPTALEPRMAAAALVTIFELLSDDYRGTLQADPDADAPSGEAAVAAIDRALAFIAAGIAALAAAP
jgi:AcrR family transcriptional regulator